MLYRAKTDPERTIEAYKILTVEMARVPGTHGFNVTIDTATDEGEPAPKFNLPNEKGPAAKLEGSYLVEENGNMRTLTEEALNEEFDLIDDEDGEKEPPSDDKEPSPDDFTNEAA